MNNREEQVQETYPDGSESGSSSYHHYRLLESQLQRLEGRLHKFYKAQRHTQKTLQQHVLTGSMQLLEEATSRDEISRVVNQLNHKVTELQANSKTARGKNDSAKTTEVDSSGIVSEKFQELQREMQKQLKQEAGRIGKLEKQLLGMVQNQQVLRESVQEQLEQREGRLSTLEQTVLLVEQKSATQIEQAITSIQQIIKDYLNDQTSLVLQVRSIEERLQNMQRAAHPHGLSRESQLIELTPRDPQFDSAKKKQKEEGRHHAQSLPQPHSQSAKKYPAGAFSKPIKPEPQHSSSQNIRAEPQSKVRASTQQRQNSHQHLQKQNHFGQRSYSSKKITDLREKLKQFEMINTKYQQGPGQYEADHTAKSQAPSKQSLDPKQAINQLKQFKFLLENTESEMDISNTFNMNSAVPEPPKPSKYKKVDRLYKDVS